MDHTRPACHIQTDLPAFLVRNPAMRQHTFRVLASTLVVTAAATFPLAAARAQSRQSTTARTESSSGAATIDGKKVLTLEDFARWNRIASPALSADGKWMTFTYTPNEGGQTILHVKALDDSKDYTVAMAGTAAGRGGGGGGRGGGGGNGPAFTGDSKWAAYFVTPAARGGAG